MTDRDDILEALAAVAAAIDARDWDTIRTRFTPDTVAYGARGIDALVAQFEAFLGGVGATQHLLGNHRVTVDGDTARSLSYGRIHHVGAGPMDGASYAGWQISRRWFEIRIEVGDFAVLRPAD
jgi:hypothetical protein